MNTSLSSLFNPRASLVLLSFALACGNAGGEETSGGGAAGAGNAGGGGSSADNLAPSALPTAGPTPSPNLLPMVAGTCGTGRTVITASPSGAPVPEEAKSLRAPEGGRLAIALEDQPTPLATITSGSIVVAGPEVGSVRVVATFTGQEILRDGGVGIFGWSASGDSLLVYAGSDNTLTADKICGNLWLLRADGSAVTRLTDNGPTEAIDQAASPEQRIRHMSRHAARPRPRGGDRPYPSAGLYDRTGSIGRPTNGRSFWCETERSWSSTGTPERREASRSGHTSSTPSGPRTRSRSSPRPRTTGVPSSSSTSMPQMVRG
jgi:hypothetical protein